MRTASTGDTDGYRYEVVSRLEESQRLGYIVIDEGKEGRLFATRYGYEYAV